MNKIKPHWHTYTFNCDKNKKQPIKDLTNEYPDSNSLQTKEKPKLDTPKKSEEKKREFLFKKRKDLARTIFDDNITILADGSSLLRESLRCTGISLRFEVVLLVRHSFFLSSSCSPSASVCVCVNKLLKKRSSRLVGRTYAFIYLFILFMIMDR